MTTHATISDRDTVAGATGSQNFPTTANAFQRTYGGGARDAFVVKFSSVSGDDDEAADE
jgi:hypothetical protein